MTVGDCARPWASCFQPQAPPAACADAHGVSNCFLRLTLCLGLPATISFNAPTVAGEVPYLFRWGNQGQGARMGNHSWGPPAGKQAHVLMCLLVLRSGFPPSRARSCPLMSLRTRDMCRCSGGLEGDRIVLRDPGLSHPAIQWAEFLQRVGENEGWRTRGSPSPRAVLGAARSCGIISCFYSFFFFALMSQGS